MKKWINWNWGKGIAALYSCFAIMMLVLVYKASSQDFHLVTKDYYEREVNYQQHIDMVSRTNALNEKVNITSDAGSTTIQFPHNMKGVSGNILLYRSSDAKQDHKIAITPDKDNSQHISLANIPKGNWQIQIDWQCEGVSYYNEQPLIIK